MNDYGNPITILMADDDQDDRMLTEVESLSDEEAQQRIADKEAKEDSEK